ncbi:MAG TPA: DUF4965 domain-containing protein [Bryobacteraceae bacterium]|nr:DUF4965 domain-containing protein [Bryobacteraceae bacterium]
MTKTIASLFARIVCLAAAVSAQSLPQMRPPAAPLIVHDPYFSIWSMSDQLTETPTRHWTGTDQPLTGMIRIDGAPYRFLGAGSRQAAPAMNQTSREITPTRTTYKFEQAGLELTLTFLTPALPNDLEVLSRPVTYISFSTRSTDAREHQVGLYFDASTLMALNVPEQRIIMTRARMPKLDVVRAGSAEQQVLAKSGDNLRIDWGYVYLAVADTEKGSTLITSPRTREEFGRSGDWPQADELDPPSQSARNIPVLAVKFDLGSVGASPSERRVLLAYDDVFAIQYFHRDLRAWWRRNGATINDLLPLAASEYPALAERCRRFDEELMGDLVRAGGAKYAQISTLAYRHAIAAHKLVADIDNTPLFFPKENFSNGCIGTVDVIYPSAPEFLLLNPALVKGMLTYIFQYASLPRWPWPFAPHDIGQYPLANGQVYGGGERTEQNQMPVEESGNMIILTAAVAQAEGNADYARKYWPLLTKWAEYLRAKGMDPENQLCTDDFAGHLAHNANLSVKAIVALSAYGRLASMLGMRIEAGKYQELAQGFAKQWMQMAADGDHYRLAFDKPGTWSQKYNLVWDRILGLNLFPPDVARKEVAFYLTKQNKYGLPLDNRETYTKLDWELWTATLADRQEDFRALTDPVFSFLNESTSRVPMTDWYWTVDGKQRGFQARSVVGGVFVKMLAEPELWRKWASTTAAR